MQALKKADERKVKIAALLRQKTSVKNVWISDRLAMGDGSRVSRLNGDYKKSKNMAKLLNEYDQLCQ